MFWSPSLLTGFGLRRDEQTTNFSFPYLETLAFRCDEQTSFFKASNCLLINAQKGFEMAQPADDGWSVAGVDWKSRKN
jgi:hypothetical protein